jgi:hypothetical protein
MPFGCGAWPAIKVLTIRFCRTVEVSADNPNVPPPSCAARKGDEGNRRLCCPPALLSLCSLNAPVQTVHCGQLRAAYEAGPSDCKFVSDDLIWRGGRRRMGRRWGRSVWQSRSSQHLFSRPQLVCWRVVREPPTWACRVQAYKLPTNAGRVAVLMSLTRIIENCDRPTASLLIRAILIRPSPITISDRCGPGRVTGATLNKYTSARAKPRRRSSRSDSSWCAWKVVSANYAGRPERRCRQAFHVASVGLSAKRPFV